jgi:hypothetical protein
LFSALRLQSMAAQRAVRSRLMCLESPVRQALGQQD